VLHLENQQEKREYGTEKTPQIRIFSPFAGHNESEETWNTEKKQDEDKFTHGDQSL
jgi:hypothetical protein